MATPDGSMAKYVEFVTANGFSVDAITRQLERLKFETIVTGRKYSEVLDELVPYDPPWAANAPEL